MTTEAAHRLPRTAIPSHYDLVLEPDLEAAVFSGRAAIDLTVTTGTDEIVFNAAELEISHAELIDLGSGVALGGVVTVDEDREQATLALDGTAESGSWRLHLDFAGILNDRLRGFYRSTYLVNGEEKVLATTQFEATEARRAFPCWDEPDLKATFDVTLVVADGLMAISNSPVIADEATADGRRRARFGTTMRMSTYLVAFIVGELEATEEVDVDGVPLRVVHVPGKGHLTDFALEVGAFALRFFTDYYGIPYPGDKVDMIGIPDFAFGAMENLGAVIYRETALLVDPATATQGELSRVADVIAHELAHMWFGDLVTMRWWNGIWLNEAFATFMEMLCVDAYRPDWKRWLSFAEERNASMDIDGLATTRPIEIPVGSPEEANEMFDSLTYSKGASVLRMLEQYLGAGTFRRGISHYLKQHAYANTETHDLWAALEAESGQPVAAIMDPWIFQGGHPLIEVARADGGYRLRQEHFQFIGGSNRRWMVPARYRDADTDGRILIEETATVDAGDDFFLNRGGQGYFRTRYDPGLTSGLTARLGGLAPGERYSVVADTWAALLAGDTPPERYLEAVTGLGDEDEVAVWGVVLDGLDELHRVVPEGTRLDLEDFVARLAGPTFERIGWAATEGETDLERRLRGMLLGALGVLGADGNIISEARILSDRLLSGDGEIDSEVAAAAVRVFAANGSLADHERLVAAYEEATQPQDEDRYLSATAAVPDPEAATRTLDMVIDGRIRTQNAARTVARLIGHRTVGAAAWEACKVRWEEVTNRFPQLTARTALSLIHYRSEPEVAADVASWVTDHPLPGAEKFAAQQLERLQVRLRLRERAAGLVVPR